MLQNVRIRAVLQMARWGLCCFQRSQQEGPESCPNQLNSERCRKETSEISSPTFTMCPRQASLMPLQTRDIIDNHTNTHRVLHTKISHSMGSHGRPGAHLNHLPCADSSAAAQLFQSPTHSQYLPLLQDPFCLHIAPLPLRSLSLAVVRPCLCA